MCPDAAYSAYGANLEAGLEGDMGAAGASGRAAEEGERGWSRGGVGPWRGIMMTISGVRGGRAPMGTAAATGATTPPRRCIFGWGVAPLHDCTMMACGA